MKKLLSKVLAVFMLCSFLISFAVSAAAETETVSFIPKSLSIDTNKQITRESYCASLINLYEYITNKTAQMPNGNPFSDTDNPDVLKAYNLGIVNGFGDNTFGPKQYLTSEQQAKMLYYTLLKIEPNIDDSIMHTPEFSDADKISPWALEAVEYLYHHNIITVDENNNINPKNTINVEKAGYGLQNAYKTYNNTIANKKLSVGTHLLTCSAYSTQIAVPSGNVRVDKLITGDQVLTADMSFKWSTSKIHFSGGTDPNSGSVMIYINFGDNNYIIVSSDQLFLLSSGKLKRASNLVVGKDYLVDKDGKPVAINSIMMGNYYGGINAVAADTTFNGSPDGHLLLAQGVVIGDFTLQIYYDKLDKQYVADTKNLPYIVD